MLTVARDRRSAVLCAIHVNGVLTALSKKQRIGSYERRVERLYRGNPVCQRLGQLEGIGALTATAFVATVAHAAQFKNGRQCAAWLGLVPRQDSTGGKPRLLGISKRGEGPGRPAPT